MEKIEKPSETETPAKTSTSAVHAPAAAHEPRNFLVAFLLTISLGVVGLRHFYLGNKKLGWIRTGMFFGGYIWVLLFSAIGQGIISTIGLLAIMAAWVWAIVDFFYVYNAVKLDADGQPLTLTARDKKWARSIYLGVIILCILSFIAAIVGGAFLQKALKDNPEFNPKNNGLQQSDYNYNDFLRDMESQNPDSQSY